MQHPVEPEILGNSIASTQLSCRHLLLLAQVTKADLKDNSSYGASSRVVQETEFEKDTAAVKT